MRERVVPAPRRAATLLVVTLAVFTDMVLYTMVIPILPVYAESLGASATAVSILFAVYSVALLMLTPLVGGLSDRVGRRGPMLIGLLGLAASTLLFAASVNYPSLLIARTLQGVAAAITWSAGLALLADTFDASSRGWAMGIAMAGVSAGSLLGPPLGGLLYELGGYHLPFLIATCLVVLDGVARFLLIDAPQPRAAPRTSMLDLVQHPEASAIALVIVVSAGGLGLLEPTLPLFLDHMIGASASTVGLLFAGSTLAYAVTAPLSGHLVARWGTRVPLIAGLALLGGALAAIGQFPAVLPQAGLLLALGIANGLIITPALTGLADIIDDAGDTAYGVAYGLFNTAYAAGLVVGPLLGGVMSDALGFPLATLYAGVLPLGIAAWLALTHHRPPARKQVS